VPFATLLPRCLISGGVEGKRGVRDQRGRAVAGGSERLRSALSVTFFHPYAEGGKHVRVFLTRRWNALTPRSELSAANEFFTLHSFIAGCARRSRGGGGTNRPPRELSKRTHMLLTRQHSR
jgi:hypothetical protein